MSRLVAHRGQNTNLPENTLEAVQAAMACGATAVEFDVQMTADLVPVVCHDISLLKTAGVAITIAETNYLALQAYSVGEPARFENAFPSVRLPSLQAMVAVLQAAPDVIAFVELKDESIAAFGIEVFLEQVLAQLEPIQQQCVVIADDLQALTSLKKQSPIPVGWIIHRWQEADRQQARQAEVDYMVINHEHCQGLDYDFTADNWDWVMYETRDPARAASLFQQGVRFVETNDICAMLAALSGKQQYV